MIMTTTNVLIKRRKRNAFERITILKNIGAKVFQKCQREGYTMLNVG